MSERKVKKIGVDVSEWQENINYKKAVNSGVEFAIIRSGYGWKAEKQRDKCFDKHLTGFKSIGVPCGVYHYSYAKNEQEAIQEAEFCLKCIKGYHFQLPIFYDMEEQAQAALGKDLCTKIAIAFCDRIEQAGYKAGVYANANWFTNYLDYAQLKIKYSIWLAQWSNKPQLEADFWQYTDKGKIDGIIGNADMNYGYLDICDKKQSAVATSTTKKTNKQIAKEVVAGKWGNGAERKRRLTKAGYSYTKVQKIVNSLMKSNKTIDEIVYTVKTGDTLWGIAVKYLGSGTEYKRIMELNGLKSDTIHAGQRLKIPH